MIVSSESHHSMDEEPLEENTGGAAGLDPDGWPSAEGPKQGIRGCQKSSGHVQKNDIELND